MVSSRSSHKNNVLIITYMYDLLINNCSLNLGKLINLKTQLITF